MAVKIGEYAVSGDEVPILDIFPQYIALEFYKTPGAFRHEPVIVQHQMGIMGIVGGLSGNKHFIPSGVGLVPKHGSSNNIQVVQGAVFLFEKFSKVDSIAIGVEFIYITVDFVVDLPSYDI
jgi:hypothetical protein